MDYVLNIKKRPQSEWFVLFMILMPFAFGTLIDMLHLPNLIKYSIDIMWLLLLLTLAVNRFTMPNRSSRSLLYCILVFLIITLIGFALNVSSPLYYLWGFRNNFRFFIFFLSCIVFLREQTARELLRLFDKLFYLNFFVMLLQFFVLGLKQDYLGGIFGSHSGSNADIIIFFSIVVSRSVLCYLGGSERLAKCLVKCAMALTVAALAEIKVFLILFVFIVALCILMTEFTVKKVAIVLAAVLGVGVAATLLIQIFPEWENWFSLDSMIETAISSEGYTGRGGINRLNGASIVWDRFLNDWPKRLFGLGLGNCDTSAFSFLNTPFFVKYGYLNYNWFSIPFLLLETGLFGLLCYIVFFVMVYYYIHKRQKRGLSNVRDCLMARVMTCVALVLIVYNGSMRIECAYFMYFILAIPFLRSSHGSEAVVQKEEA